MRTTSKIVAAIIALSGCVTVAMAQISSFGTTGTTAGSGGVMLGTGPDTQPPHSLFDEAAAGRRTTATATQTTTTTTTETTKETSKPKKRSRASSKASPSPSASVATNSSRSGR